MIKQIAHVCFGTRDLARAIAFYGEHFGAKIVHEFRNDKGELYGVFLSLNGTCCVEFFLSHDEPNLGTQFRHFCFEVDDLESVAREFSTKGFSVELKRGRTDRTLQFWIQDPDGIRIEFHQYDAQSVLGKFVSSAS